MAIIHWHILYSREPELHISHTTACLYFKKTKLLLIQFGRDRSIYGYKRVPWSVYMGFRRASSHGSYFRRHIDKRYDYQRLDLQALARFGLTHTRKGDL